MLVRADLQAGELLQYGPAAAVPAPPRCLCWVYPRPRQPSGPRRPRSVPAWHPDTLSPQLGSPPVASKDKGWDGNGGDSPDGQASSADSNPAECCFIRQFEVFSETSVQQNFDYFLTQSTPKME